MGKISDQAKKRYSERIKEYKQVIAESKERENTALSEMKKEPSGAELVKLSLAEEVLNRISYYNLLNVLSVSLLGVKNEGFLNDARKECYKGIIYLEEVVSNYIDVPFSEYENKLEVITDFSDEARYALIRKLGFSIESVKEGFGENSKWKWSFVELEGRYATVIKNLLNLKTLVAGMDPRIEGYETRLAHIELMKSTLHQAADRYREKYELSTLRMDDFKLAIAYLSALRRILILIGQSNDVEMIRKKIDVWKGKMESDLKKEDTKRKTVK